MKLKIHILQHVNTAFEFMRLDTKMLDYFVVIVYLFAAIVSVDQDGSAHDLRAVRWKQRPALRVRAHEGPSGQGARRDGGDTAAGLGRRDAHLGARILCHRHVG